MIIMKAATILAIVICVVAAAACVPAGAAQMRGLWADAFHPGFKSPEQTSVMVAKARECNFNALFVQVRKRGDVYYRSRVEPMAADVAYGYDPLADVIAKAHAVGLEVHAWITVYEVYQDLKWKTPHALLVHARRPKWVMRDDRGRDKFPGEKVYLDPGSPGVQEYLVGIVREIVSNYRVDGIHLDVVKYPGPEGGYNEASLARFNEEMGRAGKPEPDDEAWCAWRRAQVTRFVGAVYQRVTRMKRGVKLSAAVLPNKADAYARRFQDWEGWLKAGILDFVVPMVFPSDNRVFRSLAMDVLASGGGRPVYIGQGGYGMTAARGAEQIQIAGELGAPGVVVYNYHYCSRAVRRGPISLMDALKAGLFAQPDVVPTLYR